MLLLVILVLKQAILCFCIRRTVHSGQQFFVEVTNQITNFISSFFQAQVTKMWCIILLHLQIWNVYGNWIIQHILSALNRKNSDLRLVIWLVTSPKKLVTRMDSVSKLCWIHAKISSCFQCLALNAAAA